MEIRLNKFLSEAGVCSRREADRLIADGRVLVGGVVAKVGQKIKQTDVVEVNGKVVSEKPEATLLLFHKPVGVVCTTQKREKNNIVDFVSYPIRLYPVGRLDKDSRGLILLTNQGELVNRILKSRFYHEKEYIVRVDREITADFVKKLSNGVYLEELNQTTRPCTVEKLSKFRFRIILTQGLNRQIRRMCEALSYRVLDLQRIRIMNLTIDGIKEGTYREIYAEEMQTLLALLGEEE